MTNTSIQRPSGALRACYASVGACCELRSIILQMVGTPLGGYPLTHGYHHMPLTKSLYITGGYIVYYSLRRGGAFIIRGGVGYNLYVELITPISCISLHEAGLSSMSLLWNVDYLLRR